MFITARDKVTIRQYPQTTTFEEKEEPKRIRTEVPLLTSLTPTATPNRLTGTTPAGMDLYIQVHARRPSAVPWISEDRLFWKLVAVYVRGGSALVLNCTLVVSLFFRFCLFSLLVGWLAVVDFACSVVAFEGRGTGLFLYFQY